MNDHESAMKFDETRPIYIQIMENIKSKIARGELKPGSKLPSVRELSGDMGVNPNTIARAYSELEREGVIVTRRGQGTYVTDDPQKVLKIRDEMAASALSTFLESLRALGLSNEEILNLIAKTLKEERK